MRKCRCWGLEKRGREGQGEDIGEREFEKGKGKEEGIMMIRS
jgi:hypothetical protein